MRTAFSFAFAVLIGIPCSHASTGTAGRIAGVVRDKNTGTALPSVEIAVEGAALRVSTDAEGRYVILSAAPGNYTLSASTTGYHTSRISNVRAHIDLTTQVDFELLPQSLSSGEQTDILTPAAQFLCEGISAEIFEQELIASTPADDFKEVLTLHSSMTTTQIRDVIFSRNNESGEGSFFVRGGRGDETALLIEHLNARDAITGGLGMELANVAIQEMKLLTGGWNAEYGNAMSGMVQLAIPEGGERTTFLLRGMTDALFGKSTRDYTFTERDQEMARNDMLERSNWGTTQAEFRVSGPAPFARDRIKYFAAGDYFQTEGHIGVLQNEFARRGTIKLNILPARSSKLTIITNGYSRDQEIYQHAFAHQDLYPYSAGQDTLNNNFAGNDRLSTRAFQGAVSWLETLNPQTFLEFKLQYFTRRFFDRVRNDPAEYAPPILSDGEDFVIAGDDPRFLKQEERLWQGRLDFTWQAHAHHRLQAGIDWGQRRIWRKQLLPTGDVLLPHVDEFTFRPREAATYVQDEVTYQNLIVHAGLRLEYFDSDGRVPQDPNRPLGPQLEVQPKVRVSPRVGFAYPFKDRATLHFAYGHFYQFPAYNTVFFNSRSYVDIPNPGLGNADLEPQKTAAFEVGWTQQLRPFMSGSVAAFYKDIDGLVSTSFFLDAFPTAVAYFANSNAARAYGVEINLSLQRRRHVSARVKYTFSRAEGLQPDYPDIRNDFVSRPSSPGNGQYVITGWDRPHVLNFGLDVRYGQNEGPRVGGKSWLENFGVNLTGRLASGLPYTPTDVRGQPVAEENSARRPMIWQLDLRAEKFFAMNRLSLGIFTEVLNLTNQRNVIEIFTDTGLPDATQDPGFTPQGERDPYNIGPQRNVRVGLELRR